MKQEDIKGLSKEDLLESLAEQKSLLVKQNLNHAVSPLENPMVISSTRKTIARIKTELRKRELQEVKDNNK